LATAKPSLSVYTCRSSRLLALTVFGWLSGLSALGALVAVAIAATLSPDSRALIEVLLGVISAGGIVAGARLLGRWLWVRFELTPETLRYCGVPTPRGPAILTMPWEKIEIVAGGSGAVIAIDGQEIAVSRDLLRYDRFLEEIEERRRERIPFPQVGWPDDIRHPRLTDGLLADVQRGILSGQTIQMMKVVQDATGIRSKECLDLVERLRRNLDQEKTRRKAV
jgi:hypothetical protein